MNFLENLRAVVTLLGLAPQFAAGTLSPEDQASLIKAYEESTKGSFKDDLEAWQKEQKEAADNQAMAEAFKELASALNVATPEGADVASIVSSIRASIDEMKNTINNLGAQAQPEQPEAGVSAVIRISGPHTTKHAFGVQHPMFAAEKRWNKIAMTGAIPSVATSQDDVAFKEAFSSYAESLAQRYAQLASSGMLEQVKAGTMDYDLIKDEEIGTRYFVRRQDALIARIASFPSLTAIFPMRSNIQDGDVLTNVLFEELSQAYQEGKVSKGHIKFVPEKAQVHDVMFKYLFKSLKWIETSYLGYLNTNGSDPVKWTMIEWLVLEIAKKLSAERIERQVLGHRVEPVEGKKMPSNFGATGIVHRLFSYFDEHKVLPFRDASLATYTADNMGDVLSAFMDQLSEVVKNPAEYTVYVNAKHMPWYKAWYKENYGQLANFSGVEFTVPNHENPIVFVPAMGNIPFIFASIPGNIQPLENVPGEAYKVGFQQDLESVWAYSYWKDGAGSIFSGVPRKSLAELEAADYADQIIFMNWPAVEVAADATTVDAKKGIIFRTGENTKATALTDIVNAREGVIYRIEAGAAANATSIAKDGKFSEISAAWSPTAAGEYIKLYYDAETQKFHDVARG